MTQEQIDSIVKNCRFPGPRFRPQLIETHISWVILSPAFVFKIKKPVQFPFLDFSTPEKRDFFCHEEIRLNRRLAPEMYLGVLPIGLAGDGQPEIGVPDVEKRIEFAVWMKRMDDARQMDKLLLKNAVSPHDLVLLAKKLVLFHQNHRLLGAETGYRAGDNRADFADLFLLEKECALILGGKSAAHFGAWREKIHRFLDTHEPRLHARAEAGFWVDGHGDLHASNIFLLEEGPVVFDCIEFNPHFRRIDVLNELAFLCMDLDAGGHHELEKHFQRAYFSEWPCLENREDEQLFLYFKTYRANVRLKIALLEWQQHPSADFEKSARVYWGLMHRYLGEITA